MPPEDPLYSYLTDRLREGKLCEPISPATQRKKKHSIARSDMSISSSDASSANSSRKVSTASNSSWSSQSSSSSKCYGFANYQPPRKFSAVTTCIYITNIGSLKNIQNTHYYHKEKCLYATTKHRIALIFLFLFNFITQYSAVTISIIGVLAPRINHSLIHVEMISKKRCQLTGHGHGIMESRQSINIISTLLLFFYH